MNTLLKLLPSRLRGSSNARPRRFVIAGGINTVIGLSIYPLLLWSSRTFSQHYMVALMIAQALGLCSGFLTYKLFVYRTRGGPLLREFTRFSSFYVVNYVLSWLMLPFLVEIVRIPPVLAQVGFALIIMICSYFWHSNITFGRHEPSG